MRGLTAEEEQTGAPRTRQRTEEREGRTRGVQQNISEDSEGRAEDERGQREGERGGVHRSESAGKWQKEKRSGAGRALLINHISPHSSGRPAEPTDLDNVPFCVASLR